MNMRRTIAGDTQQRSTNTLTETRRPNNPGNLDNNSHFTKQSDGLV